MDAKTRRLLKQKQGRIASGSGEPSAGDGIEGQVEVREVNGEPILFARLNGKWLKSPLAIGGAFFVPKAFTADVVLPAASGKSFFVVPHFIPLRDILNISVVMESTSASATYFIQMPAINSTIATAAQNWLIALKASDRTLYMSFIGDPTYINKNAKLTILYK
jgi:hypothetical protein